MPSQKKRKINSKKEIYKKLPIKVMKKDWLNDALWNMVGSGSSKYSNISIKHDKHIY